jgi:hypothetical protein
MPPVAAAIVAVGIPPLGGPAGAGGVWTVSDPVISDGGSGGAITIARVEASAFFRRISISRGTKAMVGIESGGGEASGVA